MNKKMPKKRSSANFLYHSPDYTKLKRCHECEYSSSRGFCKNFILHAHLHNGCIKGQEAADGL